jgi:hypothetical protein
MHEMTDFQQHLKDTMLLLMLLEPQKDLRQLGIRIYGVLKFNH